MVSPIAPMFTWQDGKLRSPGEIERERKVAEGLLKAEPQGKGFWGFLGQASSGLAGAVLNHSATQAEQQGIEAGNAAFAGIGPSSSMDQIIAALSNPWVQQNKAQASVAQALLGNKMEQSDPSYQLDLEYKRAQLDALRNPQADQQSLMNVGGGLIYNPNDGTWISPPGMEGGVPAMNVDGESKLRNEYNGINTVKDYGLQTQAYQRVLDSATDPSAAGDLALIFNYMKVLDPGSTVREGEFATAASSGSIPEQIQSQYNRILNGERLAPEIRKDFVTRASQLFEGASGLQENTNERYSGLAEQYGYDPSRIVAPVPQIGVLDPSFDLNRFLNPQTGEQTAPLPVTNDAEYEAIPSGATFEAPDGSIRVKP
ncbi:hypothetical protein [Devosia naphthalenivorans]|uniref:hypothetical protein n=1 Tax=Devosia naphthalenivorans TaxID=2082392 RepID=UPI000D3BAF3B|nr:hypothetical protein [Devosia naphthalenivorans]